MLDIGRVLATVLVDDVEEAVPWYERLLGRPPDSRVMAGLAEWQLTASGGLQVVQDAERAGKSSVTLLVADIDDAVRDLAARGLTATAETVGEENGVPRRIAQVQDPAGNTVVLAATG